ncbi:MAG: glutamate racemase [Lachnospiraceae bacterium]|nr:glutamate racemase [Lachnospiraceae bacterium]
MNIDMPIGFMDSGLGGISVLREALKLMPREDYIYYGDSLNAPYGVRPTEEIRALTVAVVEKLLGHGIKGLVVACNTATSAAVRYLRENYSGLPIVGIEPAVKPAVEMSHGGRILVMATPMTIAQEKYKRLLKRYAVGREIVSVPCAGLMEFVESGDFEGKDLNGYFEEHLAPYLTDDTETIVLGCTHYPFIRPQLKAYLDNDGISIIDGSAGTAREIKRRLMVEGLLQSDRKENGTVTIFNSLNNNEIIERSEALLKMNLVY